MYRLSYTILLAVVRLASANSTSRGRLGFSIGNNNGCVQAADFIADFGAISNATSGAVNLVRVYGAGGATAACPQNNALSVLEAAKQTNFQVLLGAWTSDDASWEAEKAALQQAIPGYEDQVYGITVGSEGLYRSTQEHPDNPGYNDSALARWVADAVATFPSIAIGTADTFGSFADGLADQTIRAGPNLLLVNVFPYWTEQFLQNATAALFDNTLAALSHIQAVSGSPGKIHVMIGETGWPTDGGGTIGNAVAGTVNAIKYFQETVCAVIDAGVDVFYFEAFDESAKPQVIFPLGGGKTVTLPESDWGAFDSNRVLKPG